MMATQQLDKYRQALHALRAASDDRATTLRDEACRGAGGSSGGELSNAPIHLADMGNQETDAAVNLALAENEALERREIDAALERLDAGRFGVCEQCHEPIDRERLTAIPYTRWCIRCAERSQQSGRK